MALDLGQNSLRDKQSYCTTCDPEDGPRSDSKNLVICIDGTSNQFGPHNTSVIELYSQLVKNDAQLTYYDSGIGTYARPSWKSWNYWKQVVDNKIDLAIAWNFETLIIKAYRWLADHYRDGDRIFLFGFSRGAYQCRALAGMIHKVGLIHRGNESQIPFAYEIYADPKSDKSFFPPSQTRAARGFRFSKAPHTSSESANPSHVYEQSAAARFKDTFSRDAKVHFVGVWDTVSSIGIIRGKNLPLTDSPEHICFFRHALALDERRIKFLPEYARGGVMLDPTVSQQAASSSHSGGPGLLSGPRVKETWFTGTHSDIGGGNVLNPDLDRSGVPLLWMSYEAISAGLLMKLRNVKWRQEHFGDVHESLTGVWKLFEYLPFRQLSYRDSDSMTLRLHRRKGRQIQHGQKIHASVAFSPSTYRPKAVLPEHEQTLKWEDLIRLKDVTQFNCPKDWEGWVEMDIYDSTTAQTVIDNLGNSTVDVSASIHRLTVMTGSAGGCDALRGVTDAAKKVFRALQRDDIKVNVGRQVEILNALIAFATEIPGISNRESLACILPMLQLPQYRQNVQRFITQSCQDEFKLLASLGLLSTLQDVLQSRAGNIQRDVLRAIGSSLSNNSISPSDTLKNLIAMLEGKEKLLSLRAIIELAKHGDEASEAFKPLVKTFQDDDSDVRRIGFMAIEKLLRRDDPYRKLLNSNLVEDASNMLKSDKENTQRLALDIITVVARHEDGYGQIMKSNVLTSLLDVLGTSSWILRCCAVEAIIALSKYGGFRSTMAETSVLTRLIGFLQVWGSKGCQSSFEVVAALAKFDDFRSKMLETDVLARLVGLLQVGGSYGCQSSIDVIAVLAKYDDLRSKVLEKDVHSCLFGLLERQDSDVQRLSVNAITTLAEFDDFRSKMMETNILACLVDLLRSNISDVSQLSIDAIAALAKFDDFRYKMIETDFFTRLNGVLQVGSTYAYDPSSSVNAISVLAKYDDFRSKVAEADVLARLFDRLEHWDKDTRRLTVNAITTLAEFDDFRSKIMERLLVDFVPRLSRLSKSREWKSSSYESYVDVIVALANFDDFGSKIMEIDIVACLVDLFQENDRDPMVTVNVFVALAKFDDLRYKMMERDFLAFLVRWLRGHRWYTSQLSIGGITALAKFDDFRSKMVETDTLACLLDLVKDHNPSVQRLSVNAITTLAEFNDSRSKMMETNVLACFVDLLRDRDLKVRQSSIDAIAALAKFDDFRYKMIKTDVLARLVGLLQDRFSHVCQSSVDVIVALANFDNFRFKMTETDVLLRFFGLLEGQDKDIQQTSVDAITTLAKFDDIRSKMVEIDVVARLVGLLQDRHSYGHQSSIKVITALAKFDNFHIKMMELDVVTHLVGLLQKSDLNGRESSAKAIINLAKFDSFYSKMVETGVFFSLVDSLQQLDVLEREPHFQVITAMVESDHIRIQMLGAQTIRKLVKMIGCEDTSSHRFSTNIIGQLAKYDHLRSFPEIDVTPSLISNFDHGQPKVQCSSINCVIQYTKHDVLDTSKWLNVFKNLLPLLYSKSPDNDYHGVQQACLDCICQSSERDNCRSALLEAGLLSVLMDMLEDNDHYFRVLSLKAIAELVKYDDFRELLCEYVFVTSMVGIVQAFRYVEQRTLLDAVGELAKYEETRSRLLCSRFISCLVATLSECSAQGLPEEFPPDLPHSFVTCVAKLEAHKDLCSEMTKCGYTPSMLAVFRDSARQ